MCISRSCYYSDSWESRSRSISGDARGRLCWRCILRRSLVEGLHALTCVVVEAVERPAEADRALLLAMTADRGEMMEKRRRGILAASPELDPEARLQLVHLMSLFEREVWLLRQLVQSLPAQVGSGAGQGAASSRRIGAGSGGDTDEMRQGQRGTCGAGPGRF